MEFALSFENIDIANKILNIEINEQISYFYEYKITFRATQNLFNDELINENAILNFNHQQYFKGVIYQSSKIDADIYQVVLASELALLKTSLINKVYYQQDISQIIESILLKYGINSYNFALSQELNKEDFIIQYQISDFDFLIYLMSLANIYFYIDNSEIVFSDHFNKPSKIIDFSLLNQHKTYFASYKTTTYDPYQNKLEVIKTNENYINEANFMLYAKQKDNFKQLNQEADVFYIHNQEIIYKVGDILEINDEKLQVIKMQSVIDIPKNSALQTGKKGTKINSKITLSKKLYIATSDYQINSLLSAKITKTKAHLNACAFNFIFEDKQENAIFARSLSLAANINQQINFLPKIGDEVLISFIDNNPQLPIILGSLFNQSNPYEKLDIHNVAYLKTKHNALILDEKNKSLNLNASETINLVANKIIQQSKHLELNSGKILVQNDKALLEINSEHLIFNFGNQSIKMSDAGIEIQGDITHKQGDGITKTQTKISQYFKADKTQSAIQLIEEVAQQDISEIRSSRYKNRQNSAAQLRRNNNKGSQSQSIIDEIDLFEKQNQNIPYLEAANAVYSDDYRKFVPTNRNGLITIDPKALQEQFDLEIKDFVDDSFNSAVYKSPIADQLLITFQGTNMTSGSDWGNNIKQGLGIESFQYQKASKIGEKIADSIMQGKTDIADFQFVGHSLGGGLAQNANAAMLKRFDDVINSLKDIVKLSQSTEQQQLLDDYDRMRSDLRARGDNIHEKYGDKPTTHTINAAALHKNNALKQEQYLKDNVKQVNMQGEALQNINSWTYNTANHGEIVLEIQPNTKNGLSESFSRHSVAYTLEETEKQKQEFMQKHNINENGELQK